VSDVEDYVSFYIIAPSAGPHPYPAMVRDFQSVIGIRRAREQLMEREGRLPDTLVAAIGGGSNAMGLFHPFLDEPSVKMIGRSSRRRRGRNRPPTPLRSSAGVGAFCTATAAYLLQDDDGQIAEAHSISAGLDYPGIGAGAFLAPRSGPASTRQRYDTEARDAFQLCTKLEGSSRRWNRPMRSPMSVKSQIVPKDHLLVMNLCGPAIRISSPSPSGWGSIYSPYRAPFRQAEDRGPRGLVAFVTAATPNLAVSQKSSPACRLRART